MATADAQGFEASRVALRPNDEFHDFRADPYNGFSGSGLGWGLCDSLLCASRCEAPSSHALGHGPDR
jgi:hypothetical protein